MGLGLRACSRRQASVNLMEWAPPARTARSISSSRSSCGSWKWEVSWGGAVAYQE